jgi:hypothetical protein
MIRALAAGHHRNTDPEAQPPLFKSFSLHCLQAHGPLRSIEAQLSSVWPRLTHSHSETKETASWHLSLASSPWYVVCWSSAYPTCHLHFSIPAAPLFRCTPPHLCQRRPARRSQFSVHRRRCLLRCIHAPDRSLLENLGTPWPRSPHGELRPRFSVHDLCSFRVFRRYQTAANLPMPGHQSGCCTQHSCPTVCRLTLSFCLCPPGLQHCISAGAWVFLQPDDNAASAYR